MGSTHYQRQVFVQRMASDPEDLRREVLQALATGRGVRGAADHFGLRVEYFRLRMAELGIKPAPKEQRHFPTRIQLWNALVYYRGDHTKVADHFKVSRRWVVKAIQDYQLRRVAPTADSPYWRAYAHG